MVGPGLTALLVAIGVVAFSASFVLAAIRAGRGDGDA